MQSEPRSEYARAREVPAWVLAQQELARALEELARVQEETARTLALAQAQEWVQTEAGERILAWVQAQAQAQAEMAQAQEEMARAQEEGARTQEKLARAQEEAWARAQEEGARTQEELARAQEEARARVQEARVQQLRRWVQAEAEAQAEMRARAPAQAQAAARAAALARALAKARPGDEISELATAIPLLVEQGVTPLPQAVQSQPPPYAGVLADSKIKAIIDSIIPIYRHRLTHHLWDHPEHWWLIQVFVPVTRLPPELLHLILSPIIDDASNSPLMLMLVCKRWYTTVTGIWAPLKLGTRTPRNAVTSKLERNLLDVVVDTEIDRGDFTPSEAAYEAIFAAIEATSRWRSLVVETIPGQADLPEHLVNRGFQRCSNATMSRLKTFKVKSACEKSPLLDRLLRILGTTASPELTTVEIYPANVISLLAAAYPPFFRSVKVLTLNISGRHDPVDLLPHLHQLEELTASHLSLPIYADDINLPFVNTLRHLTLRAVSIQWMSGRTFDVLESCAIRFPLRRHIPPIFRSALPNCKHLIFQGHHLDMLDGVSTYKLDHLSVTSSGSFNRRGARQLVWFSSQILEESRLAPRILHISIEATSQAWMSALTSMTHLEELVISNARPSSLRAKVLQSLIAQPVHANRTGTTPISKKWDAPLCPSLKRFGLKYHRWLRPSEHFDLIPDILSIIFSRWHSNCPIHSFSVWLRSDQKHPFELIERGWRINQSDIGLLADESRIEPGDLRRIRHMLGNE